MSDRAPGHPSGVELRGGGLVRRALELLRGGPRSTQELAEALLGVRGDLPSAAAAVFTLLGTDSRFEVDARGVWSLPAAPVLAAAGSLREEEWVVVDVETTGGSPGQGHRVTEVAAVRVSGGQIVGHYSSLVNPQRRIPSMITALTGISDQMVRDAPLFYQIAPRLGEELVGRVFVAHNAAFDWRFVSSEMERSLGQELAGRQLCTVRLARRLLPQLPSRTLDALANYFALDIESRHRALDDAVATAKVLIHFLDLLEDREVTDWAGVQALLSGRKPRARRSRLPRSMDQA